MFNNQGIGEGRKEGRKEGERRKIVSISWTIVQSIKAFLGIFNDMVKLLMIECLVKLYQQCDQNFRE